ncbi:hypothetical protein AB0L63_26020 [Nocardia sp. NPDC051990]|uniref:hypothetical protein n=1 Tax=Nocardia sp. NPDC051990 TaxID=3155285 RepID=UPI0034319C1B
MEGLIRSTAPAEGVLAAATAVEHKGERPLSVAAVLLSAAREKLMVVSFIRSSLLKPRIQFTRFDTAASSGYESDEQLLGTVICARRAPC